MEINKSKFIDLVTEIVNSEMDEYDKTQFEIERDELFHQIFNDPSNMDQEQSVKFVYGISPEALEAIKVLTPFGCLIISIISLYITIRGNKNQSIKTKVEKLELIGKLKDEMIKQEMKPEFVERVCNKYKSQLENILTGL